MTLNSDGTDFDSELQDTELSKNKLLRLALINSYLKGQYHIVDIDKNTILTGRNGTGKTSLMAATVPFFGVKLSKIVNQSGVKDSFVDFYLPHANSYLVYEYIRQGVKKCVILRNDNGTQQFSFVNAKLKESWFVKQTSKDSKILLFSEVRANIEADGVFISNDVPQMSYEAIISNCPNYRLRKIISADKTIKEISKLRQDFSLATGKGSFYGFAPISSNILNTKLNFGEICEFLVEAMRSERKITDTDLTLKNNDIDISGLVYQRDTWNKIDGLRDFFDELARQTGNYLQNQSHLSQNITKAEALSKAIAIKLASAERFIEKQRVSIGATEQELRQLNNQRSDKTTQIDKAIKNLSYDITRLEAQKQAFLTGDNGRYQPLHQLQTMAANKPILDQQMKQLDERLQTYQAQFSEANIVIKQIEDNFEKEKRDIDDRKKDNLAILDKAASDIKYENGQALSNLETTRSRRLEENQQAFDSFLEPLTDHMQKLEIKAALLEQSIPNTTISETFKDRIVEIDNEINAINDSKDKAFKDNSAIKDLIYDNDRNLNKLQDQDRSINEVIERTRQQKQELEGLIQGESLHSFLIQSEEASPELMPVIDTIKSAINPKLLSLNNLSPQFDNAFEDKLSLDTTLSFYGLIIDTQKIAPSAIKSRNQISEDILKLGGDIANQLERLEKNKEALDEVLQQRKNHQQNQHQITALIGSLEQRLKDVQNDKKQTQLQAQTDINKRKAELLDQLKQLRDQIAARVNEKKRGQQSFEDNKVAIDQEIAAKKEAQAAFYDNQQRAIEKDKNQVHQNAKNEHDEALKRRDKAILNKGYDSSEIDRANLEKQQLETQIKEALDAKLRCEQYQSFMQDDYQVVHKLTQEKSQLDKDRLAIDLKFKDAIQRKSDEHQQLKTTLDKMVDTAKTAELSLKTLNTEKFQASQYLTNSAQVDEDQKLKDSLLLEYQSQKLLGLSHNVSKISRSLRDASEQSLQIAKHCKEILNKVKQPFYQNQSFGALLNDSETQGDWLKEADRLIDYMNHEHENKRDLIIGLYTIQAQKINDFKHSLDKADEALSGFARRINHTSQQVCQNLCSLAIESLKITLTSNIKKNTWYITLNEFSKAYDTWRDANFHDRSLMPSADLLLKLDKVDKDIGQNKLNIRLADEFRIEIVAKQRGQEEKATPRSKEFADLGSNGTMRIAQLVVYLALLGVISDDDSAELKFCIDESAVVDPDNTQELLSLLDKFNITTICAAPEKPHDDVIPLFFNNIHCSFDTKNMQFLISQIDDMSKLTSKFELESAGVFDI